MIVFLTGAGLSANSGLPTYRGAGGVYTEEGSSVDNMPIEEFLSYDNWLANPEKVEEYKNQLAQKFAGAEPSQLHKAIAWIEQNYDSVKIFTQNIDDLHEKAGSTNIIHLHGNAQNPVLFGMNIPDSAVMEMENVCTITRKLVVIGNSVQFDYLLGWIEEMLAWGAQLCLLDTDPNHVLSTVASVHETDPASFIRSMNEFLAR